MTTIEKAAQAIVREEGVLDWDTMSEPLRDYPRGLARAALAEISTDEIASAMHADDLTNDRADMAWDDMHPDTIDWYESNARAIRAAILGER